MSLEILPAELKVLILYAIPDTATLRTIVYASSNYHTVYFKEREPIFKTVVERELDARCIHILRPTDVFSIRLVENSSTTWHDIVKLLDLTYDKRDSSKTPIFRVGQYKRLLEIQDIIPWDVSRDSLSYQLACLVTERPKRLLEMTDGDKQYYKLHVCARQVVLEQWSGVDKDSNVPTSWRTGPLNDKEGHMY